MKDRVVAAAGTPLLPFLTLAICLAVMALAVYGYRAVRYDVPRGCAAGYMPELNVLCGIADYSTQSGQPATKHLEVEVTPSSKDGR